MDLSQAKPIVTPAPTPRAEPTGEPPAAPPVQPASEPATIPAIEPDTTPIVEPDLSLEPATSEPVPKAKTELSSTGNTKIDSVGKLLADKGVANIDGILAEAISGDLSIENQSIIVEALGDSVAKLALEQLSGEVAAIRETASTEKTRLMEYAAEAFGDDPKQASEVWTAIQEFAKSPESGLTSDDRAAMSRMLNAGGLQAELVIDKLNALYHKSENYTQEADLLQGDSISVGSFDAISQQNYTEQMREVAHKYGYESPEADRLRAKRTESIARGY